MYYILIPLGCLTWLALGIAIGVYKERIAWNKLIENGTIPKPKCG